MRIKIFVLVAWCCCVSSPVFAFWIWTPETRQWINPKYAIKETPQKQLDYALEMAQGEQYKEAEREMQKLLKHYPKAREAAEAQFYIAEFQERQGDFSRAFKSYQMVIEKYPFTDRANDVVKRQYDMGNRLLEGKSEGTQGFWAKVSSGGVNVQEIFAQVIKNAPYGEYAAPAQYKIGLFLKEEGLLQEARDAFEKTVNDYPDSEWAKAARFQIAMADADRSAGPGYDQQITKTAIEGFKDFVRNYPDAELSQKARARVDQLREKEAENLFLIAQFYEKQKKIDAAKMHYAAVVQDYPDTVWARKSLEKIQQLEKK